MRSLFTKAFPVLWRLSILILPWQTRWIFLEGSMGGFPWEQGTVSIYASQMFMFATIVVGAILFRWEWKSIVERAVGRGDSRIKSALALFILVSTATASWIATGVWWAQVILVAGFLLTLGVARIPLRTVAMWFVIALIPHAVLAIHQYVTQDIAGSAILGIAEHHPWEQGTSVVEHGLYRILRVYGGFPHPNIFGGWLAAALILIPLLTIRAKTKIRMIAYVFMSALLATALVFTFSRGAWIAGALGFLLALFFSWKSPFARQTGFGGDAVLKKQAVLLLGVITIFAAGWGVFTQFDHIKARFTTEYRLEAWSIESRTKAIQDGIAAWKLRPVIGWGPGASLIGVSEIREADEVWHTIAPEPPHLVPLVILVETGVLGAIAVLVMVIVLIQHLIVRRRWDALPMFIAGSVIAMTDHYLWTLWPGLMLMGLMIYFILYREHEPKQGN